MTKSEISYKDKVMASVLTSFLAQSSRPNGLGSNVSPGTELKT